MWAVVGELYANALKTLSICLVYGIIWPACYLFTPFALLFQYCCFNFAVVFWWRPAPQLTDELMFRMHRGIGVMMLLRYGVELMGYSKADASRNVLGGDIVRVVLNLVLLGLYYADLLPYLNERKMPSLRRYRYEETDEDAVAYEDVPKHSKSPLARYECPTLGSGRRAPALEKLYHKADLGLELYTPSPRATSESL